MKVIGVKKITKLARKWLEDHDTIIERHHGLWVVFLPDTLVVSHVQDVRYPSSIREVGWQKLPVEQQQYYLLIEASHDDKRTIYTSWQEAEPGA